MEYSRENSQPEWHYSRERVIHFPFQVKSPEELRVREKYLLVRVNSRGKIDVGTDIEIIAFQKRRNITVKVETASGCFYKEEKFLSDYGIVPYENSYWNKANCLVPVSHRSDLQKIIEERAKK